MARCERVERALAEVVREPARVALLDALVGGERGVRTESREDRLTGPHLARRALRLPLVGREIDGVERNARSAVAVAAGHAQAAGHREAHDLHDRVAGQVGRQNLQIARLVSELSPGGASRTDDERERQTERRGEPAGQVNG